MLLHNSIILYFATDSLIAPSGIGLQGRLHQLGVAEENMVLPPVDPNVNDRGDHGRRDMDGKCITGAPRGTAGGRGEDYAAYGEGEVAGERSLVLLHARQAGGIKACKVSGLSDHFAGHGKVGEAYDLDEAANQQRTDRQ